MIGTDIHRAKTLLEDGELVAIPTETVYGLAANATDAEAVVKIFKAKDRPLFDPLICHFSGLEAVEKWIGALPEKAKVLANNFWPGSLTLILPKPDTIPDIVSSGLDHVGVRVPNHPLIRELISQIDFPVAAPSANPFGYVSPTTAQHVVDQLGERISYVLDGGPCEVGVESTIISFANPDLPRLLRHGGIPREKIEALIGPVEEELLSSSKPAAPGQLEKHYSPKTKFEIHANLTEFEGTDSKKTALLYFQGEHNGENQFVLSENGDLEEAARSLFRIMRQLDEMNFATILAESVPNEGLGRAINDRLKRAASR